MLYEVITRLHYTTVGPLLKGLAFQETQNKARCKGPPILLHQPYEMSNDRNPLPAARLYMSRT